MFRVLNCLTGQHDYRLVALAAVICLMSAYSAFWLYGATQNRTGARRIVTLLLGSACTAAGIWTTHFVGMLAYDGGVAVTYNGQLTALSLVIAVVATTAGFGLMTLGGNPATALGGAIIGLGISGMHFTGMEAVIAGGRLSWDQTLVNASIILGVALSAAASLAHVHLKGPAAKYAAPLLLTLAICAMHFTAMGAATFTPDPTMAVSALAIDTYSLALSITAISTLITLVCIFTTIMDRITIARGMLGFGGTILATLTATIIIAGYTMEQVRIGGGQYTRISASKDLIADILPPPLYIVEAYLETKLATETPDKIAVHKKRLETLKATYLSRVTHWRASTQIPDLIKKSLAVDSDILVNRFWQETETKFLPALARRDKAATTVSMQALTANYLQHRRIVEELVERSNVFSDNLERDAVARSGLLQWLVILSVATLVLVLGIALLAMRHFVIRPVLATATYLKKLADGHYEEKLAYATRQDEIGAIAEAVETLRLASIEKQRLEAEAVDNRRRRDEQQAQRTKERAAEALRLHMANEHSNSLNKELNSTIVELKRVQEEIVRKGKLAQLGQLTATVAHEIRNPLGAIKTAAFLIERKTKDKGLGIEGPMQRVNTGIKRCDTIITELLDFTRTQALALNSLVVDDWVHEVVGEERRSLPTEVVVKIDAEAGPVPLLFDDSRMRRVLVNLLSNASEAMVGKGKDKGGLTDGEATVDPQIVVTTRIVEGNVEFVVTDNGPGMSPETLARIREPLFTTKSFGVGLGLPAVENILEEHGGGLKIDSVVGQGTTMIAWFPVKLGCVMPTDAKSTDEDQKVA